MLTDQQRDYLGQCTRRMQIIAGTLASSVVVFGVVVLVMRQGEPAESAVVSYVAIPYTIACLVGSPIVAARVARMAQQSLVQGTLKPPPNAPTGSSDVGLLAGVYQTRLIIAAAIIEGAAFLNLVAYLLEGHVWTLAATVVLLFILLMQFPTTGRVENWVSDELESVQQLRGFSN
ncbi:MAG: hypothetical protein OES79_14515 [Planctomycetota bacterium]|nr:hypothetical protein [Planctomycetota bacterium]